jgi:hypothetical protein
VLGLDANHGGPISEALSNFGHDIDLGMLSMGLMNPGTSIGLFDADTADPKVIASGGGQFGMVDARCNVSTYSYANDTHGGGEGDSCTSFCGPDRSDHRLRLAGLSVGD